jgi:hypothetical protein
VTVPQAYATLGLDASSTAPDEARSRFRDLIRLNHPDGKPSHEQARANETTCAIVEACTLLRAEGFPRVTARNSTADASGLRNEPPAPAEPKSADPFAWLDEMQRDCVCTIVCVVSPAFGLRFALRAWTTAWEIMWAQPRKFK